MIFLHKDKVDFYQELHLEMVKASEELFKAYRTALPDKQDWLGRWGWQGHIGTVTFDETEINYNYEFYFRGDSSYFSLILPMGALHNPTFIEEEVNDWETKKARAAVAKIEHDLKLAEQNEKEEYQRFLELKRKYERSND